MEASISPVTALKGVGAARAAALQKLGIVTVGDLVACFPRDYKDLTACKSLADGHGGDEVAVVGEALSSPRLMTVRPGLTLVTCEISDGLRHARCTWYNQPYLRQMLHPGQTFLLIGKLQFRGAIPELIAPTLEPSDGRLPAVLPIYPLTQGISQRVLRGLVKQALELGADAQPERLPEAVRQRYGLACRAAAVRALHQPESMEEVAQAQRRMGFEELLLLMTALRLRKSHRMSLADAPNLSAGAPAAWAWTKRLGFVMTGAQVKTLQDIQQDVTQPYPMNRMVQGDVGSGKTAVALAALLTAVKAGYQGAYMAPTEVLAHQLYEEAVQRLEPEGVQVRLLTGGLRAAARRQILQGIQLGLCDLIVGTHALIQDDVVFHRLGLVVTDEQHRFGVRQRAALGGKGACPHVLVMSATPVPRSLSLILYGDLELSVMDELPPGRKPIRTRMVTERKRTDMYDYVAREAEADRRTYIICPAIEQNEEHPVQDVQSLYRTLTQGPLAHTPVGVVHGRMSAQAKQQALEDFRSGATKVLISTTVVEVGIHVPEACNMVIEDADRFGLAQLHQLRGRVGRGAEEAYCFLVVGDASPAALERLQVMTATGDGFRIAEEDLNQRGPGEFLGTRQSGLVDRSLLAVLSNARVVGEVQDAADWLEQAAPSRVREEVRQAALHRYEAKLAEIALN